MSEPKFTPGPWVAVRNCSFWEIRDEANDFGCIGDACASSAAAPDYGRSMDLGEANARVMAAGPELYAELRHLVRLMEPLEDRGLLNIPGLATLNGARAALAKAEGQQ